MRTRRLLLAALGCLFLPGVAAAHEVGTGRFEAPLPPSLLFLGAGATVGLTALALGATDVRTAPGTQRRIGTIGARTVTIGTWIARVGFLLAVVVAIVVGFVGPQVRAENLATVFVWPVWLRGVAIVAVLVGSPWRVLSPWRTAYDALAGLEGREIAVLGRYPDRLAEWPALALLLGIVVVENLTTLPRSPTATATVVAAYALLMLAGGLCFGREWFERADALAVLYRLLGRVAPLTYERRNTDALEFRVRPPWRGATIPVRSLSAVAVVVATVYTVSFDGFTDTPEYQALLFDVTGVVGASGVTGVALLLAGFVGFLAAFGLVVATVQWLGGDAEPANVGPDGGRDSAPQRVTSSTTARALAPTVLPIAAAYELAHTYPYVLRNVGQLVAVLTGWVGAHVHAPDPLWWLSLPAFWSSQVALIVAGHVLAVVAAHEGTRHRSGDPADAQRAHAPVTLLMIAFTVVSLWIVSRPVVS